MISQNKSVKVSIVSPVYRAEKIVERLVNQIEKYIIELTDNYEIILVEDGSPDDSWSEISRICKINDKVKGVKLSRNFGQHYAITAGLDLATGDAVIVMDCDLQDRPDQFMKLFEKYNEGYDIVFAKREERQDSFLKRTMSKLFYKLFSYLTNTKQDASIANFGIYSKKSIDAILSMGDYIRYFPTMSQWVGFNKCAIGVEHGLRDEGKSSYTFMSLFNLAFNNIIAFSDKPLRITIKLGFIVAVLSGLVGFYYLIASIAGYVEVTGFASIIISIWFLSGSIIFFLGMLGIYLGKTFENTKQRPLYIIEIIKNNVV